MHFTPLQLTTEIVLLFSLLALAVVGERFIQAMSRFCFTTRLGLPVLAAIPYYLVAHSSENFRWWFVARLFPVCWDDP